MISLLGTKIICCAVILCLDGLSLFSTYIFIRRKKTSGTSSKLIQRGLSVANCFSIGLFLSVCFLGLYNSAAMKIRRVQSDLPEDSLWKKYPLSEALLCVGLFILWVLEWSVRSCTYHIYHQQGRDYRLISKQSRRSVMKNVTMGTDPDDRMDLLSECTDDLTDEISNEERMDASGEIILKSSFLKSVLLAFAMSLHTFLEALGFGLLDFPNQVVSMALAMALHQILCSSTLGLRFARASDSTAKHRYAIIIMLAYLLLLPLGTLSGSALHSTNNPYVSVRNEAIFPTTNETTFTTHNMPSHSFAGQMAIAVLQTFAAAAFLYVVFVEMLPGEVNAGMPCAQETEGSGTVRVAAGKLDGLVCCLFAFLGFLLIASIRFFHHG